VIKVDSIGSELCLPCGEKQDGVLVERQGVCSNCGRKVEGEV
jgi:hypothetical protein